MNIYLDKLEGYCKEFFSSKVNIIVQGMSGGDSRNRLTSTPLILQSTVPHTHDLEILTSEFIDYASRRASEEGLGKYLNIKTITADLNETIIRVGYYDPKKFFMN